MTQNFATSKITSHITAKRCYWSISAIIMPLALMALPIEASAGTKKRLENHGDSHASSHRGSGHSDSRSGHSSRDYGSRGHHGSYSNRHGYDRDNWHGSYSNSHYGRSDSYRNHHNYSPTGYSGSFAHNSGYPYRRSNPYRSAIGISLSFGNGYSPYPWAPDMYSFYQPSYGNYGQYRSRTRCRRVELDAWHHGHPERISVKMCSNPWDGEYIVQGSERLIYCPW